MRRLPYTVLALPWMRWEEVWEKAEWSLTFGKRGLQEGDGEGLGKVMDLDLVGGGVEGSLPRFFLVSLPDVLLVRKPPRREVLPCPLHLETRS